ncbi:TonB-dependent receptor [Gracilimonas mengyeensis]|uniref:Outer membrane receptor proteins, mostly Fe transport n=1 Tax=Gracilimonas mengyeensis TaxID=1302730 RepID=A0A521EJ54_9BACT|nr:TonB-dependent receptor [Gracilimonas mengyeensis]SMO83902.1 Outer membrane receptor proteins, mostly Fe transport [Gracilimonas mengyeensis]
MQNMIQYILKALLTAIFVVGLVPYTTAQDRGVIEGQVIEAETGEPLIGVNVIVRGSALGASTNLDGKYKITNIRPGEYSIEIRYVGFEGKLFTGIQVNSGETTELNAELNPQVYSSDEELTIVGEAPIFDVEKSSSATTVSREQIEAAPVRKIDDVVGMQAGVIQDPTGIYIKGGRAYETGYVVDGVSAQDPLAGTGFGLDLGANAYSNVEVTTGGVGAEHGDVTSGVVSVQTRDGSDELEGSFTHKRDNFGQDNDRQSNFYQDIYELNLGGPEPITSAILPALEINIPGDMYFYFSGQASLSNEFTKTSADQVQSSIVGDNFFSPRQDNRWNGMMKLTYKIKSGMRLEAAYQRSLTVNQNTRMLQITGNDVQIRPGYQFPFQQDLDNANTYTHDSNLSYLKWTQTLSDRSFYDVQISRLFTRLRADANGRDWRPSIVDGEFDPQSIQTYPASEFQGTQPYGYAYILPGSGFINNGGIATLWHDHFAEEVVARGSFNQFFGDRNNQLTVGFEMKFNDYQWIDITRPWVGAPIEIAPGEFSETLRVGERFDAWRVKPKRGALYITDKIRYQGLIADVGLRFEYWAPGKYVDDLVNNPQAPIPDFVRDEYKEDTQKLFGMRFKTRILPKIRVSFPVRENQVLFFNYGHSTRVPHPTYVYSSLDPFYQNQSALPDLGNPNLNPEVDISYEIGLRNQITANDALNVTAFWRDKYDFVTTQTIVVDDPTGRPVNRAFRINGDYARSRGVELTYIKRYQDWAQGQIGITYSRAEGLSSTNNDNLQDITGEQLIGSNVETPLAWDRPWDIKGNITLTYDRPEPLFGLAPLNQMRLFLSAVARSGIRYTPQEFQGFSRNPVSGEQNWRPIYERVQDPALEFSETGPWWFYMDLNFRKWFTVADTEISAFLEISNLLNNENAAIVNPVTGKAYKDQYPSDTESLIALRDDRSYDMPNSSRDPRYLGPGGGGIPSYLNPANFLQQRQIMFGLSVNF